MLIKIIQRYQISLCTLLLSLALLMPAHLLATQENQTHGQVTQSCEQTIASNVQANEQNETQNAEQSDEQKTKKPTMAQSWRKVVTLRWKELNKADAWNICKPFAGAAVLGVLYNYWPKNSTRNNDNTDDNKPGMPPQPVGGNNLNQTKPNSAALLKKELEKLPPEIQREIMLLRTGPILVTPQILVEKDEQQYLPAVHNNKIANIVNDNIHIWDVNTGQLLHTFKKPDIVHPNHSQYTIKIYDNNVVIAADGSWQDNRLHILDITTGTYKSCNIASYHGGLIAIDDEKIVIPFYNQQQKLLSIDVHNIHTGNLLRIRSCGNISPDSWYALRILKKMALHKNKLICVYHPLTITTYSIDHGNTLYSVKGLSDRHDASKDRYGIPIPKSCITSIATSDDKLVIGFSDHVAEICDIETGDLLHTLKGHTGEICSVSIEGNQVTTTSQDQTIKIWDINSGKLIQTFAGLINSKGFYSRCIKVGDKIINRSFPDPLAIWPLYIDSKAFEDKDSPLAWIKNNINLPLTYFIHHAQINNKITIAWPNDFSKTDKNETEQQYNGRIFFSLPEHVRNYLRTRLNIKTTKIIDLGDIDAD